MSDDVGHNERAATSDPASLWMALLALPAAPKRAMSALELDGYLTGVIVAPSPIQASRWMAGLWDEDEPLSDDATQMQSALGAIWAIHDALSAKIERSLHRLEAERVCDYRPAFQPAKGKPPHQAVRTWAQGFWKAMALAPTEWSAIAADERLQPIITPLLGFIDVGDPEFEPAEDIDERLDAAAADIPRAILLMRKIAQLRASRPAATRARHNGRNDPCPCGQARNTSAAADRLEPITAAPAARMVHSYRLRLICHGQEADLASGYGRTGLANSKISLTARMRRASPGLVSSSQSLEWHTVKIVRNGRRARGRGSSFAGIIFHVFIQRKDRPWRVTIWESPTIRHRQPAAVANHDIASNGLEGGAKMLL